MAIVMRHGLIWTAGDEVPERGDIVIDGGMITSRFGAGMAPVRSGDKQLDLGGAFVMPGLIDCHVHLVWSGGGDPAEVVRREGKELTLVRAVAHCQAQLAAGVTTVADLGSNWDLAVTVAKAVDAGIIGGPTVLAAGRTVIMTGGHDPFWGNEADGVDAIRAAVRQQRSVGARLIKTAATGGVYGIPEGEDVGQAELSLEELTALCREAHRFGLRVAAHALGEEGIRNAVEAGADVIEHGTFLTGEIIELMRSRGTFLCPTLAIYRTIASEVVTAVPEYAKAKARSAVQVHRESFDAAREAGIPVIAGTDAGSCSTPHPALCGELETMVECGMGIDDVLRSATLTAARALGIDHQTGTLQPGMAADVVTFARSPFDDIGALRAPEVVVHNGVLNPRAR